jgi:hypothetical protein
MSSKFAETKARILKECEGSGSKKTFNENYFNELGTALLNDPSYEKVELKVKNGELTESKSTPITDLRKNLIGSVAKAAGCDSAEQEKLVAEHQFPKLPLYDYVESTVREYVVGTGKKFPFARQENMQAAIEATTIPATIKEVRRPGETEKKKQRQGEYIKLRAKSTCPDNLKENL